MSVMPPARLKVSDFAFLDCKNLVAIFSGHLAGGPLWMTSTATALMVMSLLPLARRGTSYSSPITGSGLPKPMTGTAKPTLFNLFLLAYSMVTKDWLLPLSNASPTSVLPIFTRCLSWNTWVPGG